MKYIVMVVFLTVVLAGAGYLLGYARHYNAGCQRRIRATRRALKLYVRVASILIWALTTAVTVGPFSGWVYRLNGERYVVSMGTLSLWLLWVCFHYAVYVLTDAAISNFVSRGDKLGHNITRDRAARHARHCRELAKCGKDMIKCPAMNEACVIDSAQFETRKVVSAEDISYALWLRKYAAGSFSVRMIGRRIFHRPTGKPNSEQMLDQWIEQIAQAEEQKKQPTPGDIIQFKTIEVVDLDAKG